MTRVAVIGASGFVGSAVCALLSSRGNEAVALAAPRVEHVSLSTTSWVDDAVGWLGSDDARRVTESIATQLDGCAAVVNAAGLATPGAAMSPALLGANALLPALVARGADAMACRWVHVSSVSVQAGLPVIDESDDRAPNSPYSATKALGEELLQHVFPDGVIYRATSVQGPTRSITKSLVRLVDLPFVPLSRQARPIPLATIDNCASAIVHLATEPQTGGIHTHPWEGVDTVNLIDVLDGSARRLPIPAVVGVTTVRALTALSGGGRRAGIAAWANRAELLLSGKPNSATRLHDAGWQPAPTLDGYRALATAVRAR